ncbi:hypothetical protein AAY473_037205 [Plecturocebus cupreus]
MQFNTNERPQQAVRHNRGASSMGISISSGGDLETLPQQALPHNRVASSIKSSTSSGGDLETLAQQALQCNCVVAAYIGNKDLETLILQALHHDLMASLLHPENHPEHRGSTIITGSHRCQEVHFNTNERPQQALQHNRVSSSVVVSINSLGDLETLPQEALPHNHGPHPSRAPPAVKRWLSKPSRVTAWVAAYIGNKDLETLTLQALQHDLMASSFTQSTTQSTVAQESSQEATVLQARQPGGCVGLAN